MDIFRNVKNWCKDKKAKAKKFYERHKVACNVTGAIVGTAIVGGTIYALTQGGDSDVDSQNNNLVSLPDIGVKTPELETPTASVDDWLTKNWKEDYRESWDKVNDLAKDLDLADGEEFIITGPNTWEEQPHTVVSHLIYGDGVYPPEETIDGQLVEADTSGVLLPDAEPEPEAENEEPATETDQTEEVEES